RPDELDSEIELIRNTAEQEKKNALVTTWATLMASRYRYLVIAGVGVAAFQQFQGANAIFYYIPLIVETATATPRNRRSCGRSSRASSSCSVHCSTWRSPSGSTVG